MARKIIYEWNLANLKVPESLVSQICKILASTLKEHAKCLNFFCPVLCGYVCERMGRKVVALFMAAKKILIRGILQI